MQDGEGSEAGVDITGTAQLPDTSEDRGGKGSYSSGICDLQCQGTLRMGGGGVQEGWLLRCSVGRYGNVSTGGGVLVVAKEIDADRQWVSNQSIGVEFVLGFQDSHARRLLFVRGRR